jgi:outer membrane protein assembly factor BamD (BamD/ComL family)
MNLLIKFFLFFLLSIGLLADPRDLNLPFPGDMEDDTNSLPSKETKLPQTGSSENNEGNSNLLPTGETPLELDKEKLPEDGLPNLKKKKKKIKGEAQNDPSRGAYPRANYHLHRADENRAVSDYNQDMSGEGESPYKSKLEMIRLLAKQRKSQQAKSIIDGMENPDQKFSALFELAMGLHNSAKSNKEKEESLALYLYILTEAPSQPEEPNPLIPRTAWAIAVLLFQLENYMSALDHLSKIIIEFKNSEYFDDALYLSGKIYEEGKSPEVRNLERAKKYYKMFLDLKDKEPVKNSIYLKEVKDRYTRLKGKI